MASPISRLLMVVGAAAAAWYGVTGVMASQDDGVDRPPVTYDQSALPRTVTDRGSVRLEQLQVGDCLRSETTPGLTYSVMLVPCTKKHHGEVFAEPGLRLSPYPGEKKTAKRAEQACRTKVPAFAQPALDSGKVTLTYLYPSSAQAAVADSTATCVLESSETVTRPLPRQ